jgi:hypothetical protein
VLQVAEDRLGRREIPGPTLALSVLNPIRNVRC